MCAGCGDQSSDLVASASHLRHTRSNRVGTCIVTETPVPPEPAPAAAPTVTSEELLQGGREATILHGAEVYRLRLTSKDKLILTK
ncbi:hemin uptake protein HemP [Roseomonas stagni]|uniref:Hemin uptake protein HemP n=1 Tax=Falsiroseomonas algicola TaxID=2716930 RepID=A0A6M1LKI4_9PROT|nr:hemin uptake protein HemP [Falsiroseomonas algicola]